jgi:hypothetical protein
VAVFWVSVAWWCFLSFADALLAKVALRHMAAMMNFFLAFSGAYGIRVELYCFSVGKARN